MCWLLAARLLHHQQRMGLRASEEAAHSHTNSCPLPFTRTLHKHRHRSTPSSSSCLGSGACPPELFLPQPSVSPLHPTITPHREAEHSSSSKHFSRSNKHGVREERRYVCLACVSMCGWSRFLCAASADCRFAVPSDSLPPQPIPPPRTHRHGARQENLIPNHHGRGLGCLQCDWLVLLHVFTDHAGAAAGPRVGAARCAWRRKQQQWGEHRGRGRH